MKKIILLLAVLSFFMQDTLAQQDAEYTQYMFNPQIFNPAYVGSREVTSLNGIYRNQWLDLEGSPVTVNVGIHGPLKNDNVALGAFIENDKLGIHNRTRIYGQFAYRIPVGEAARLSLGLQGGMLNLQSDYSDITTVQTNDPVFNRDDRNINLPNVGIGAYLYTKNYYIGASIPHLLNPKLDDEDELEDLTARLYRHVFATAGIVLPMGNSVKFRPAVLLKYAENSPIEYDLTAHFLLKDALWLGATYRTGDSLDFMAQYQFNKSLRAGYSYDWTTSELRDHTDGTHELMLGYDFIKDISRVITPRYF